MKKKNGMLVTINFQNAQSISPFRHIKTQYQNVETVETVSICFPRILHSVVLVTRRYDIS